MPQGRPKTDDHIKMMINFTEKTADKLERERKKLVYLSLGKLELLLISI